MTYKKHNQCLNNYHWFYEPGSTSIRIDEKLRKKILTKALHKAKTMTKLSKDTNLSKQTLFNYKYGKSMNIKGLKVMLDYVDLSYDQIEAKITEIAENKISMPISLNTKESSIFFAAILGDGSNTSKVMYKNKDKYLLTKVDKNVKNWLGKITIDSRISDRGIPYINFPRITGRILHYVGIPPGKQTKLDSGVPKVIKLSTKEVKKEFIKQFFDDEGWPEPDQMKIAAAQCVDCSQIVPTKLKRNFEVGQIIYLKDIPLYVKNSVKPPQLLQDLQMILQNDFNIYSHIRFKRLLVRKNHITGVFEIEIQRKAEVRKFFDKINFSAPSKKKKAEFMINRQRKLPSNIMLLIINQAIKCTRGKDFFRANEIAKELGYPQPPIRKRLTTLVKMGIFHKEKEKFYTNIKN